MPTSSGLGRVVSPEREENLRNTPMRRVLEADAASPLTAAPGGTSAREWNVPLVYDQGQTPRCVGYSHAGYSTAMGWVTWNEPLQFDADAIYDWANAHDGFPQPHDGSSVHAGMQCLQQIGAHDLNAVAPTGEATDRMDHVSQVSWAPDCLTAVDYVLRVSPVVLGIDWYDSMFNVGSDGFVRVTPGASIAGGHAILLKAVDLNRCFGVLHNSWGAGWGMNGEAKITFDDITKILGDQGEAAAAVPGYLQKALAAHPE